MRNPIELFFGPYVPVLLRKNAYAIRKIAERAKPYLMAQVHPDRQFGGDTREAAEISEAYQALIKMTDSEIESAIESFVEHSKRSTSILKNKVRELESAAAHLSQMVNSQRLTERVHELEVENRELRHQLSGRTATKR